MKVSILSYTAVAHWTWTLPADADDTCGICRVEFEGTCSKCKFPGDDCPIVMGDCSHNFHMHCIADWLGLESSQGKCPMCRQPFKEKKAQIGMSAAAAAAAAAAPVTPASSVQTRAQTVSAGRAIETP